MSTSTVTLMFRWPPEVVEELDLAAGDVSRNKFVLRIVEEYLQAARPAQSES